MEELYLFHQEGLSDIQNENVNISTITFTRNNQNFTISEINIFICYDNDNSQKILSCRHFSQNNNNNNNNNRYSIDLSDNNNGQENNYPKFKVEIKGNDGRIIEKYFLYNENDSTVLFEFVFPRINVPPGNPPQENPPQENPPPENPRQNNSYWIELKKVGKIMAIGYNRIKITIKEGDHSFSSIYTIDELKDGNMIVLNQKQEFSNIQYSDEFLSKINKCLVNLEESGNNNNEFDYKINFNIPKKNQGNNQNVETFDYGIKFFKPKSKYKKCCDCCCDCCNCFKNRASDFSEKCCNNERCCSNFLYLFCCDQFLKNFWKLCVFLSKFWKFLLTFGDIFFTFILFGINFITNTIMITSITKIESDVWKGILVVIILLLMNTISILPLSVQFWEAFQFRYIRKENPFEIFLHLFNCDKCCENHCKNTCNILSEGILISVGLLMFLLYILSFAFYNTCPEFFESLNLINFIIIPFIKFAFIFVSHISYGLVNIFCNCCKIEDLKKCFEYDQFEESMEKIELNDKLNNLLPVRLMMYKPKKNYKYIIGLAIISGIMIFFYLIFFYVVGNGFAGKFYISIFLLFSFLLSISIPNPLFCCQCLKENYNIIVCENCYCSENLDPNVVSKIGDKYKILKYCIIVIMILLNVGFFVLIFIILKYKDEENKRVVFTETYGSEIDFNSRTIPDLTEQTSFQDYIKAPMCYTNIHHLNFIQIAALAQAAYINNNNDIKDVKKIYYDKTIFKDSNIESYDMNFLSTDDRNIVILKSEFKFKNSESDKKLIVFSIRGTSSWIDKWLDLEMFAPSTMFTLLKMVPLINKDESITSGAINWLLTFPMWCLEDSTLLHYYSDSAYSKIDKVMEENKNDARFIFVGHSLGGGLATAASMSTDIPAITFNPAAMTEHTKAQLGIQNSAGANVTNYVVAGEPLSVLQNKAGMQLPGNTNSIYIQNSSSNPFVNSFNAHKISTIKHILPR